MNKAFLFLVIAAVVITVLYVFIIFRRMKRQRIENEKVKDISGYIHEGAMAFLFREYKVIIPIVVIMAIVFTVLGFIPAFKGSEGVGWQAAICFVVGALFSGIAGFVGMKAATSANARTVEKAEKEGMSGALNMAFTGGSILGLTVVSLGLLGLTGLFLIFYFATDSIHLAGTVIAGYGVGASTIALFARVGGGIYTKAADVGADLVGKIEAGIPEDDPRNPAVIADNVGDNVGDIAGMGSDLCESYVGSIISAISIALTGTIFVGIDNIGEALRQKMVMFPLLIAGIGIIASLLSVIIVKSRKWKKPQKALNIASFIAVGIVVVGSIFLSIFMLDEIRAFFAILAGLVAGLLLGRIAEYYTSSDYKHVKYISKQSETGHATNVIAGFSIGMQSTMFTIVALALGILVAYLCCGNYGIALAAVGMLSTVGTTVSVDGYGPISDNAGGIAQMAELDPSVREITNKLDSVGNTTAAIGKGFCIGSATLTSLALFVAYAVSAKLAFISLISVEVILGFFIGAMLPYLFTSLVIKSVGKAANKMIEEVRNQFNDDPNIMKGTSKPNYAKCVDISTRAALKEMIVPGLIALLSPIAFGFILGATGLGGMLAGALISAVMLAVFMANAGGAWDNAKKSIEETGEKGSEAHKAAVTGDTVGDPFKDTAGPAMDILIKLMSIIALILAPILANTTSLFDWLMSIL